MRLRDFLIVLCSTIIGANIVYSPSGVVTWWMLAGAVGGLVVGLGIVAGLRAKRNLPATSVLAAPFSVRERILVIALMAVGGNAVNVVSSEHTSWTLAGGVVGALAGLLAGIGLVALRREQARARTDRRLLSTYTG